jgi:ABC-type branched-subunit amino acid transport system substrate-binding protein
MAGVGTYLATAWSMTGRRRPRHGAARTLGWLLLLGSLATSAAAQDDAAARGRRLFETGVNSSGQPVEAVFGESATPIPGTLLSCAGCHGKDGKGRAVKGSDPPDITWQTLTKPYPLRVGVGRSRPPYTEPLVVRAVTMGRDSSGRYLAAAMPRFRLTPGEAADLVAYMREVGSKSDPGVSPEAISIGVVLPQRRQLPAVHDAVRTVLDAYLEDLNRAGGIFGRRVEFSFIEAATELDGSRSAARALMIEQAVLAVVVSDAVGTEHDVGLLGKEVPLVAPRAGNNPSPVRHVFYLSAGVAGELGALAVQAARQLDLGRAHLAIVYRDDDNGRGVMAALRPLVERNGWRTIDEVRLPTAGAPSDLPEETLLRIKADDALLIASPDPDTGKILSRLEQAGRYPLVLLPGSITAPEWLPQDLSAQMRILLGFELAGLPRARGGTSDIEPAHRAQRSVLAAVKLLVEGLRRAGRDVTRAKLIDAIETIQRFETGYLPPLSYGARQRIGFTGAQIVPFDPRRRQLMEPVGRIHLD